MVWISEFSAKKSGFGQDFSAAGTKTSVVRLLMAKLLTGLVWTVVRENRSILKLFRQKDDFIIRQS